MLPSFYEFFSPVKIISGRCALDNLPHELKRLGVSKPLIITDPGVVKAGLLKLVEDAFSGSGLSIGFVFDKTPPDSSILVVNEVARLFEVHQCDSIVAVGGGSVIDTAKGANIVATEGSGDLMKFAGAEILNKPLKPFIVVPTTSGTGSETTLVAVIADPERNLKLAFTSHFLYPRAAILDPRLTLTLPPKMTAATGMDALTHAMEAYTCLQKNPMSDAYAWMAIKLISENLVKVIQDGKDSEGRLALANASCMAGIAFSNSMVGMVHSLGHAAGGVCHIPHGVAMNIFLPHGLEYNLKKAGDCIGELLLPLAGAEVYASTPITERPAVLIRLVRGLRDQLYQLTGLPRTLREAGVDAGKLEEIAKTAINDGSLLYNPVEMGLSDAISVLQKAW